MNPPGVPVVNATANDTWVSWGAGEPWSPFTSIHFHVQIKRKDQLWEVSAFGCFELKRRGSLPLSIITAARTRASTSRVCVSAHSLPVLCWEAINGPSVMAASQMFKKRLFTHLQASDLNPPEFQPTFTTQLLSVPLSDLLTRRVRPAVCRFLKFTQSEITHR